MDQWDKGDLSMYNNLYTLLQCFCSISRTVYIVTLVSNLKCEC
jgi:hypothetical protein